MQEWHKCLGKSRLPLFLLVVCGDDDIFRVGNLVRWLVLLTEVFSWLSLGSPHKYLCIIFIAFIVVSCCMLFQSLLYCPNSRSSLHFKTLKSHTKTLKIRPYMFRAPLKPSSVGPWLYFATLLNWMLIYICYKECRYVDGWLAGWLYVSSFRNVAKYSHGPTEDGFKGDRNM